MRHVALALVFATLPLAGCLEAGTLTGTDVAFTRLDEGLVSGLRERLVRTFDDEGEWEDFWSRHAPDRPRPDVDLTTHVVAAVLLGEKPNACHGVNVTRVERDAAGALDIIHYVEHRPGTNVRCAALVVSPYSIVAFERKWGIAFRGTVDTVGEAPRDEPTLTVLDEGDHTRHQATRAIIDDATEWGAFWRAHADGEPPAVDHLRNRIAAVVLDEKPNACYGVAIPRVTRDADTGADVVHVIETKPSPGQACAPVVVRPFVVVAFERGTGGARFDVRA